MTRKGPKVEKNQLREISHAKKKGSPIIARSLILFSAVKDANCVNSSSQGPLL